MDVILYKITSIINTITISDILDITLVSFVMYQIIKIIRDTRAVQLLKGILALLVLYFVSLKLKLVTMAFFMENVLATGVLALIIVFQPELRRMLEHVAQSKIGNFSIFQQTANADAEIQIRLYKCIKDVCEASKKFSRDKIGALIVFERATKLGEIMATGTFVDAEPSSEIIGNVFFPNSPLHDGAAIIRDGKISHAGCFLPLSQNYEISKEMGTRHRAALGMSENSDAIIVVVSEETGMISIASSGKIERGFTPESLGKRLRKELVAINNQDEDKEIKKSPFWRVKR